ncbi:unnamed protein product [Coregonus sp. 'balchen']|nr:unnamed protein product [Coregonus sp. 'balchen']
MESGAYGASLSGGAFDFMSFIKQPQTIVRILSWLFSIVVFATITGEGYVNPPNKPDAECMFNGNDSACGFGVGIGILAFLACVIFIVLDAYFPQISNAKERKNIVTGDLIFSGVWTLFWFICFCVLANQYRQGVSDIDLGYTDPANDYSTPYPATSAYPAYPTSGPEGYQQSPFTPQNQEHPAPYQPPSY